MATYVLDGIVKSSIFYLTSYPTIFRNRTSTEPIYIKIGTIIHCDDKKSQNNSDDGNRHFMVTREILVPITMYE